MVSLALKRVPERLKLFSEPLLSSFPFQTFLLFISKNVPECALEAFNIVVVVLPLARNLVVQVWEASSQNPIRGMGKVQRYV